MKPGDPGSLDASRVTGAEAAIRRGREVQGGGKSRLDGNTQRVFS